MTLTATKTSSNNRDSNTYMVLPYTKGLNESFTHICNKLGIQVYFKGANTIKIIIVSSKGKDTITEKSGVIYRYKHDRVDCDDKYTGESAMIFGTDLRNRTSQDPCTHY